MLNRPLTRGFLALALALPVATAFAATRIGTQGPDELIGTPQDDFLHGLAGNDIIKGEYGNDDILGGAGSDKLVGGLGQDEISDYQPWQSDGEPDRILALDGWRDTIFLGPEDVPYLQADLTDWVVVVTKDGTARMSGTWGQVLQQFRRF